MHTHMHTQKETGMPTSLFLMYVHTYTHAYTLSCRAESLACCIMHGTQGSQTSGVWVRGPGASNTVGHMSAQSHHLSMDLKQIHIHNRKVQSHTLSSVAWQICTHTYSSMACQIGVIVMCCMSRFLLLWHGFTDATQHRLATTWRTFDQNVSRAAAPHVAGCHAAALCHLC